MLGVETRQRMIEAMSDLIWTQGYSATSPRQVREVSGAGQGSMYHHFPSKRDLGLAAIKHNCADVKGGTIASVGVEDPLEAIVAHIGRPRPALRGCKIGRMTQDRAVMADDVLRAPVEDAFRTAHDDLVTVVTRAQELGELPAGIDADRLADTISATLQGAYVLAIALQDPAAYESATTGLVDLIEGIARGRADDAVSGTGAEVRAATSPTTHPTHDKENLS